MPRARDPNRSKAFEIYKKHKGDIDLVEIASQLNIPSGTVRGWKNKDDWNGTLGINTERSNKVKKNKKDKDKPIAEEVKEVLENKELTDKQRLFSLYYVKCFNATKAYLKAYGCSYETAMVEGSNSLRNPKIKEQILSLKQNKLNQVFLEPSDIFQKYMDIAFADITDFLEFGREEVPVMTMFGPLKIKNEETGKETELTKIINTVKFKESTAVDGTIISEVKQGKDGASIKLQDRMKALQWLTDHMDIATEEQKAKIALLKAKAHVDEGGSTEDDGFIEALMGKVDDVWQDE